MADSPDPGMSTPSYPDSLNQPEGSVITVGFNAIYNWGDGGNVWGRIRDENLGVLVSESFYLEYHEMVDKVLQFTMPNRDLHLFAELGYSGTTTDQHEEWMTYDPGAPPEEPPPEKPPEQPPKECPFRRLDGTERPFLCRLWAMTIQSSHALRQRVRRVRRPRR